MGGALRRENQASEHLRMSTKKTGSDLFIVDSSEDD